MMREPIVPKLSAAEYLSWEQRQSDRFELHSGFIMAFAGGRSVHDRLTFNLQTAFERVFPAPCRSFGSDLRIKASDDDFFYADAGVACEGYRDDLHFFETPRIVAEVLSPSTRSFDLIQKRAAYRAMPSVEAYVIVHSTHRRIEIDERRTGEWQTHVVDDGAAPVLGALVELDAIYARTDIV